MREGDISSTSLLITLFCDSVVSHGGEIWLGSLIRALEPLGLTERLVRTAVFRLVQDDWLVARREGRRSYYRLSARGEGEYRRAARRIYAMQRPEWSGEWTLVLLPNTNTEHRDRLHKGLLWQGFGKLSTGLFARPAPGGASLTELIEELAVTDSVVVMSARSSNEDSTGTLRQRAMQSWDLTALDDHYREFHQRYSAIEEGLAGRSTPDPAVAWQLRTLLIHDYRRALLRDPELPAEMLPEDWSGFAAQELSARIYRQLDEPAAAWFELEMENAGGRVPAPDAAHFRRYHL